MSDLGYLHKQAPAIVENRVKEIIIKVAKEFNISPLLVKLMIKIEYGRLQVYLYYNKKQIKKTSFYEIKGEISKAIENQIISAFKFDTKYYNVNEIFVNYLMHIEENRVIVFPYIKGIEKMILTIEQFLLVKKTKKIKQDGEV